MYGNIRKICMFMRRICSCFRSSRLQGTPVKYTYVLVKYTIVYVTHNYRNIRKIYVLANIINNHFRNLQSQKHS